MVTVSLHTKLSQHSLRPQSQFIEMFGEGQTIAKLKSVASVISGKSIPKDKEDIEGPVAYIKVADFNLESNEKHIKRSSRYVDVDIAKLSKIIPVGSVIFAKNGAASLSNKKRLTLIGCCIDMNTMAILPDKEKLLPEFLFAIFESKNLSDYVRQGAIPSMDPHSIEEMDIPLPSISLQQQFVRIAEQADKSKYYIQKLIS